MRHGAEKIRGPLRLLRSWRADENAQLLWNHLLPNRGAASPTKSCATVTSEAEEFLIARLREAKYPPCVSPRGDAGDK
jgi:hypothetical protein